MVHRLRREGIVYIFVFCLNQIIVANVNPFGIAISAASISSGYTRWVIYLMTIVSNALIYADNLISNIIALSMLSLFESILKKYNKNIHYTIKTIIFLIIYAIVRVCTEYNELSFLNGLLLILEIIIATTSYLVLSVGLNYIVSKDITKEMNMQEKISVALLSTLLGVYIIQVGNNNVTPFKIVVLYLLSFVGTVIYKTIIHLRREKQYKYGQVYNNLVYNKLSNFSEVVRKMAKTIKVNTENNKKVYYEQGNIIFEKISQKYCSNCDRCNYCWDKEFETTYEAANIMMSIGVENGVLSMTDIPKNFLVRCKKTKEIVESTNVNLEIARNNIWWQEKINEMKYIMSMQLKELSSSMKHFSQNMYSNVYLENSLEKRIRYALKTIGVYVRDLYCYEYKGVKEIIMTVKTHGTKIKSNDIAAEISEVLNESYKIGEFTPRVINNKIVEINLIREEVYKVFSSCCSIKKDGEEFCGDNYSIIEEDIAEVVFVLSDGMGCGENAYKESKKTVEMIEEFIGVGFSRDIAINLLNSSMYINCNDVRYSTLDMCTINRYTGICNFVKIGAASTFIKRGTEVYEITSNSLPIGVFGSTDYNENKFRLYDKDIIIMMTDGLGDNMSKDNDWKEEFIDIVRNIEGFHPHKIAESIIEEALDEDYINDDISVLVAVIWKNEY